MSLFSRSQFLGSNAATSREGVRIMPFSILNSRLTAVIAYLTGTMCHLDG